MRYLKSTLIVGCAIFLALKLPGLHYKLLRNYVANKTVTITHTDERFGGGTGVHVKLPSGKIAILTNAHVCGIKDKNNMVAVIDYDSDRRIPRKVIEESDFTDLCLIEPLEGHSGLVLGDTPEPGDIVAAVGHPLLMPITMTRGEVIADYEAIVMDHIMIGGDDGTCGKKKNKVLTFETIFGSMSVCTISIQATYTTIDTFPGNSGSAMIDSRGRLIGLIFAGNSETRWGLAVTLRDIEQFIGPY